MPRICKHDSRLLAFGIGLLLYSLWCGTKSLTAEGSSASLMSKAARIVQVPTPAKITGLEYNSLAANPPQIKVYFDQGKSYVPSVWINKDDSDYSFYESAHLGQEVKFRIGPAKANSAPTCHRYLYVVREH